MFWASPHGSASVQAHKKVDVGGNPTQTTDTDQRGTQDSPLVVETHAKQSTAEAADEAAKMREQNHFNVWTIGLTSVIAICALFQFLGIVGQIVVYLKQADLMGKTLAETKKSADAALLNAQAVVASERPWLLIKPVVPSLGYEATQNLNFTFTNHGNSPAVVLYTYFDFCFLPMVEELSELHGPQTKEIQFVHTEWVEPGGQRYIQGSVPVNVVQPVQDNFDRDLLVGNKRVWMWGAVRYQGPLRGTIYESKFCYMWTHVGQFIMGGPRGANDCS